MRRPTLSRYRRLSAALAVLVAGGVGLTAPSPANAAVVAALPPGCVVPSHVTGYATCVTIGATTSALPRKPATSVAALPDGCGDGSWAVQNRFAACQLTVGAVARIRISDGALLGTIGYSLKSYTATRGASGPTWNHSVEYRAETTQGFVAGITIRATPLCQVACSVADPAPVTGSATGTVFGTREFSTAKPADNRWTAVSDWRIVFEDPQATNRVTAPMFTNYPGHRCDDALPGAGPGCVMASFRPHLNPSLSNPNYFEHIKAAQARGMQPYELHRTTSEALRIANRAVSCPPSSPTYPRPTGYECDEYPFASTYEGAADRVGEGFSLKINSKLTVIDCRVSWLPTQDQTAHRGYSACMIPEGENSSGGGELSAFYRTNRIIDGDAFTVRVKG